MPLFDVIIALVVLGLLLWLINRVIPMQPMIKTILNWVVVIAVIIWLAKIFGVIDYLRGIEV